MKPEPGDKSIRVTRLDVAAALRSVGVSPGDTVLFHSSLSSMGTVEGGADAVIDGFLDSRISADRTSQKESPRNTRKNAKEEKRKA